MRNLCQEGLAAVVHRPSRSTGLETVPYSSSGFLLDEWAATNANQGALLLLGKVL